MFEVPENILWGTPPYGRGIGIGSNYGGKLVAGKAGFVLEENEWPRIIQESGLLVGGFYISFRVLIAVYVGVSAWKPMVRGDVLPTALFCANTVVLVIGNISRPTSQGFAVLSMALALTAVRWSPKRPLPLGQALWSEIGRAHV